MSERTYIVPENNDNGTMAMLASMCQQKGIDPNVLALMNNNGFGNNNAWWILLLFLFGGYGYGGFGGNRQGLENLVNNDAGRELIMSAIQGNATAISQLASTLNCDVNALQSSINSLQNSICQVGNQVGMSSQQVINSINAGNQSIINQLSSCCCDIRQLVTSQGYEARLNNERQTNTFIDSINRVNTGLERGFCDVAYATQQQTCGLQQTIRDVNTANTDKIVARLDAMENRALLDKIDALREKNSSLTNQINLEHQNAYMTQVVGQAIAPISAGLNALQSEVNDIKCKLPETVTLPYSCAKAVPTCGLNAFGYNGFNGFNNGSLWG